jgi:predicted AlkP superfamily phosphohydrolase/phosphomutase
MSVLEKLAEEGSSGSVLSVLPTIDYPAWGSFHTGVSPGQHRVFAFFEVGANGFPSQRLVSWESLRFKTLLEILSEQGKGIVSLYIPLTYPPKPLSNCIVSAVFMRNELGFTHPSGLGRELTAQFGDLMIPKPGQFFPRDGLQEFRDIREFLGNQIRSVQKTKEMALGLMRKSPWDVALIQFYATDTVQHALWHYLDPGHPGFIPDSNVEQMIAEFFTALDRSMGELIQYAEPSAVLVFSDHGFGPCTKILNLKRFIEDFGRIQSPPRERLTEHSLRRVRDIDFLTLCRQILPDVWRKRLGYMARGIHVDEKVLYVDIEKTGVSYVDELVQRLETLVDPETGGRILKRVWRAEDLYCNYHPSRNVAILILDLAEGYTSRTGSLEKPLLIPRMPNKDYLCGTHTRESFWIWSGSGIAQRHALSIDILDLPPTILTYMGIPIPSWMEGKVIPIFHEGKVTGEQVDKLCQTTTDGC